MYGFALIPYKTVVTLYHLF